MFGGGNSAECQRSLVGMTLLLISGKYLCAGVTLEGYIEDNGSPAKRKPKKFENHGRIIFTSLTGLQFLGSLLKCLSIQVVFLKHLLGKTEWDPAFAIKVTYIKNVKIG